MYHVRCFVRERIQRWVRNQRGRPTHIALDAVKPKRHRRLLTRTDVDDQLLDRMGGLTPTDNDVGSPRWVER